jgi:amidase
MDAVGQAELVRSGELAPVELVEAACGRVQEFNPTLNVVVSPRLERARAEAAERTRDEAAFAGVPFLTKDMGAFTAGDPIAFGVRALRELGWCPKRDSAYWRRLRGAGFVDLGKTNIPELALQCVTESPTYGPCANPWTARPAALAAAPPRRSRRGWCRRPTPTTSAARSGYRPHGPGSWV